MNYKINTIYECIQGEGCLTGTPMILVRFQGCSVGCPWCDTKETWKLNLAHKVSKVEKAIASTNKWGEVHFNDIVNFIMGIHSPPYWVLITGGEPAEQELTPIVEELQSNGYKVALETSGTSPLTCDTIDWICVSPKINNPNNEQVLNSVLLKADEIKQVIGKQSDIDDLLYLIQNKQLKSNVEICLQPLSQTKKATELCIKTIMKNNWRLSLQTHKFLNLP